MSMYDIIEKELMEKKSLAALVFLIDRGRELEFKVKGKECFISCDSAEKNVSLWINNEEQSFFNLDELIENAVIDDEMFISVWSEAEILFLL